ncbi:DUF4345 domain-containing protein [Anaerocolumna jejuensis]|uniref:DUF4345 domain-containing protein n=1 Tax=Anaerocolumna jejuensis TaxID=259063 RepID=UPI003F7C159E
MKENNTVKVDTNKKIISRRIMQLLLGLIGILAIYTAYLGFAYGAVNWYYGFADGQEYSKGLLMLDSNIRFYSGLWLGVGLVLFWLIPRVERERTVLKSIAIFFFLGGIGRLISMLACGIPSAMYFIYVLLELSFPLLTLWHKRLFI